MSASIILGAFELIECIGAGMGGQVWRALHRPSSSLVAVKLITAKGIDDPYAKANIQREIQAMASLDHPGVIAIYDVGEVDLRAESQSQGELAAGTPWFAMELATGGSLARGFEVAHWDDLHWVLFEVLAALAHAHARNIVHRDIKPGNVLVVSQRAGSARIAVTDFGLALALDTKDQVLTNPTQTVGTPGYMAPEQILGEWRRYGPATDLYAVGCLSYRLCAGAPPFTGRDPFEIMQRQVSEAPPALEPAFPVPDGLADWALRLLAIRPEARFQTAADAAYALARIAGRDGVGVFETSPRSVSVSLPASASVTSASATLDPTGGADEVTIGIADGLFGGATVRVDLPSSPETTRARGSTGGQAVVVSALDAAAFPEPSSLLPEAPPLPEHWASTRRRSDVGAPATLGLGLFGLREIPFVGRHDARDRLWRALGRAHRGRTEVVVVEGATGCGKSRLVEWLAQHASECGGAVVARVTHDAQSGARFGLAGMMENLLRTNGLDQAAAQSQIAAWMRRRGADEPAADARVLAELVRPAQPNPEASGVRSHVSGQEVHASIRAVLLRLAEQRPLLIWVDDAQWGADAVTFADSLLGDAPSGGFAALIVLTVRDDIIASRPVERQLLRSLSAREGVERISLEPLRLLEHRELVERLLPMEPQLLERFVTRTVGSPLFAVQLLGDWIEHGRLVHLKAGFALRDDDAAWLPEGLVQLWSARLTSALSVFGDAQSARRTLEVAAALGQHVDPYEWKHVCDRIGLSIPDGIVSVLVAQRLASRREGGWSFHHGMLREHLSQSARDTGRWASIHAACADMVASSGNRSSATLEREAAHRVQAGALYDAASLLVEIAHRDYLRQSLDLAERALGELDRVLRESNVPEDDDLALLAMSSRAELAHARARRDDADALCHQVLRRTGSSGHELARARALMVLGRSQHWRGELGPARQHAREAHDLYEALEDSASVREALRLEATVDLAEGRLDDALDRSSRARALAEASDDEVGAAHAMNLQVSVWIDREALDRAVEVGQEALAIYRRHGLRSRIANVLNALAEVDRLRGRLAEAERAYREAFLLMTTSGFREAHIMRFNLALVVLERGQYGAAFAEFSELLDQYLSAGRRYFELFARAALAEAAAGIGAYDVFDVQVEAIEAFGTTTVVGLDVATCAQRAAQLAFDDNEEARAHNMFLIARVQWAALQANEKVADIDAKLAALGR